MTKRIKVKRKLKRIILKKEIVEKTKRRKLKRISEKRSNKLSLRKIDNTEEALKFLQECICYGSGSESNIPGPESVSNWFYLSESRKENYTKLIEERDPIIHKIFLIKSHLILILHSTLFKKDSLYNKHCILFSTYDYIRSSYNKSKSKKRRLKKK
jgi:hypothetical protein